MKNQIVKSLREKEQKGARANQKKQDMANEKRKESKMKREKVKERRNFIGEQTSGIMRLLNNKEDVWDLIGKEESFKN